MTATARLLEQRSNGALHLRMEKNGPAILQEAGSAKCRLPRGTTEAIIINTSGGLAGGDSVSIAAEAGPGASLTLTSQAAERVYRTLGPPARVNLSLKVEAAATLFWLPQETIFFEGSALHRTLDVDLAPDATFLAIEPMIFGRHESGEEVRHLSVLDRWTLRHSGTRVHAEALRIGPDLPRSVATLGSNRAMASLILMSPNAEEFLPRIRMAMGPGDGASAWNGKLVARLLAADGFHLRKTLIKVLSVCAGHGDLPRTWTF